MDGVVNAGDDKAREAIEASVCPDDQEASVEKESDLGVASVDHGLESVREHIGDVMDEQHQASNAKEIGKVREQDEEDGAGVVKHHLEVVIAVFSENVEQQALAVISELDHVVKFKIRHLGREREVSEAVGDRALAAELGREEVSVFENHIAVDRDSNEEAELVEDSSKAVNSGSSVLGGPVLSDFKGRDKLVSKGDKHMFREQDTRRNEDEERRDCHPKIGDLWVIVVGTGLLALANEIGNSIHRDQRERDQTNAAP